MSLSPEQMVLLARQKAKELKQKDLRMRIFARDAPVPLDTGKLIESETLKQTLSPEIKSTQHRKLIKNPNEILDIHRSQKSTNFRQG